MKFIASILACVSLAAHADPFAGGNAMAGVRVFDQKHCNFCHMRLVGGDGSGIFTRQGRIMESSAAQFADQNQMNAFAIDPRNQPRVVGSAAQLVDQMNTCTGSAGITLTKQDEQDLGAYLNQSYYHFK